jgi:hypothetical protein
MQLTRRTLALFILLPLLFGAVGCKYLPAKLIENPSEGTPEFLVTKALEAASKPDVESGWEVIRPYLHSYVTDLATSENNFMNLNFKALMRKAYVYTKDENNSPYCASAACYKLDYVKDATPDREIEVFVKNAKSDMPSPFRIARDPKANNEWRIKNIP